jgi:hypothetical protein
MSNSIEIRSEEGAEIMLEISKFERPNPTNADDANWLNGRLMITLKSFSCDMNLSLRTYELAQLQSELHSCLSKLSGTARLRLLEPAFHLDLVFERRGHVNVAGTAQTLGPHKTTLHFSFDSDQSYLVETNRQLQAALEIFPIRTNVNGPVP